MKKYLIALVVLATALSSTAQKKEDTKVPAAVRNAFKKAHPEATNVKWDKEKSAYEASYKLDNLNHSVLMDAKGNVLETEVQIAITELPAGVAEYVRTHYKGAAIKEAAKITNNKGVVTYEAAIKGKDIIFSESGTFIKESKD